MRPGISVAPWQEIVSSPSRTGSAPADAVSTIRLPLTRTSAWRGEAPVPSRSRASRKSTLLILSVRFKLQFLRLLASHLRNSDAGHRLKQANIHSGEPQPGRSTDWAGLAEQRSREPNHDNNVVPRARCLNFGSSIGNGA